MTEKKKHYVSPAIETERIDLPQAWACSLTQNQDDTGGTYDGSISELISDIFPH